MYRSLLSFMFCYCISIVDGQKIIRNYVAENKVQIKTINADAEDYSDLEALRASIGNSRVVMLGEQDHGDATTFEAKTRIVKFLHEQLSFDVLAFENDFFALNEGFERSLPMFIQTPQLVDSFVKGNIYSIWTSCGACKFLFNTYIPSTYTTNKPLLLTGFDNQLYLRYSSKYLSKKLDSVFRANDLSITKKNDYITRVLPLLDSLKYMIYWKKDNTVFDNCFRVLTKIKSEMESKLSKSDFWMMVMDNLITQCQQFKIDQNLQYIPQSRNIRDYQMAQNLYWITNIKYPDKKVIVWAANLHISKFSGHYKDKMLNQYQSMGTVFNEKLKMKDSTYVLGFTSLEGITGKVASAQYTIELPKSDAFEYWFPKEWEYSFIDFKKLNDEDKSIDDMFYMSADRHRSQKAYWNKVFDGVFYIRTMYPCK